MTDPQPYVHTVMYKVKLRETGGGRAVTIPVDALRSLRWKVGDTIVVVLLDDGLVLSRVDGTEIRTEGIES